MRKQDTARGGSSRCSLRCAALCVFLGCLNPRPEELPSSLEGAPASAGDDARDTLAPSASGTQPAAPGVDNDDEPVNIPTLAPAFAPPSPPPLPDAGTDAGAADAGAADAGD